MIRNRSIVNAIVGFIALVAFIFFLLCTISTPIVNSIYLFRASTTSTNANAHIQFGTFGGCGTTSNFRLNSAPSGSLLCTPTELSYEIISSKLYQNPSGSFSPRPSVLVDHNTTSALILNPLACGLAGLVLILAPIAALLRGRIVHGITTIATGLATLVAWAAFGVNTAVIVKVRSGLQSSLMGICSDCSTFKFTWGAVMPLSLIAAVLLSLALVLSALSFFLGERPPSYRHSHGVKEMRQGSTSTY